MKVLLLASLASAHTIKWANALNKRGCKILICGLNNYFDESQYDPEIELENIRLTERIMSSKKGSLNKILYIKALPKIKRLIKRFEPDIVHAHYASSYGLLGLMTGFHPFIVSVWGSDIFTFPARSYIKSEIIKYLFKKTDIILSTSNFMVNEIKKYTSKEILVTPFGIDTERFKPEKADSLFMEDDIIIGTIKSLEFQYGIEYLIRAFKIVKGRNPDLPLKLLIVGKGSLEIQMKRLADDLEISEDTVFAGFIKYTEVHNYHNMLDIYAALSVVNDESFGVAVLEAGACEKPAIVSNVGGLTEVVKDKETGIVVAKENAEMAADAIEFLIKDREERIRMGKAARVRILEQYNFDKNLENMLMIYEQVLQSSDKISGRN
jgi:glycosyltransferase involved in cell wall biosynthesis